MSVISKSFTFKAVDKLFLSSATIDLSESYFVKIFQKLYLPYLSEFLVLLSIVLYFYEGFLTKYAAFFGQGWLSVALILLAFLFMNKERLRFGLPVLWYLVFLLVAVVSAFLAISRGLAPRMVFQGWLLFAQFGFVLMAAHGFEMKNLILKGIVWASLPLALIGTYQYFAKIPTSKLWLSPGENLTRVFAFFGSPNVYGLVMVIAGLTALVLFLKERKYYWLAPLALFIAGTAFSFSRSAWLGALAGVLLIVLRYHWRWLFAAPLLLLSLLVPQIRERFAVAFSADYALASSLDGRLWAIQNGLYIFKKFPIFGTGPGTYGGLFARNYASPIYLEGVQNGYTALYFTDNQILEILVQTGLFGLIAFLAFVVSVFSTFFRSKGTLALTGLAVFTAFIVAGLFGNVLEFGAVSIPVAAIIGVALNEK